MIQHKSEKLSLTETIGMALGFTIGSGIITQTGIGIGLTGRSVCLAFLVSGILFLIAFRPVFLMSTVLPRNSAAYFYSKELIHEDAGIFYTWMYIAGRVTMAIFGISFAQYMGSLFPALSGPTARKVTGALFLTLFFLINLAGVKMAARIQKVMCLVMIAGIMTYIICGFGKLDLASFIDDQFFSHGFPGFYEAVSLLFFAVGGAYIITDFAPVIENISKVIVKIIIGVTISVCILYMLMGVAASGVLPASQAAGKPLTVSAAIIFDSPLMMKLFIAAVCIGALMTTANSSYVWYTNALTEPVKDGWLPSFLSKKNSRGASYRLMICFYLMGLIPVLLGADLAIVSKLAIGQSILCTCIPMAGILQLPVRYKEEWQRSGLAGRYPAWRLRIMTFITYSIMLTQVYALFAGNPPEINAALMSYIALILILIGIRHIRAGRRDDSLS